MRTTIWKDFTFEAAHHLPRVSDGHKCKGMHGHSYRLRVFVSGEVDAQSGWIVDFADIAHAVRPVVERLDHSVLNEEIGNPTTEYVAAWILRVIRRSLPEVVAVELREASTCGARVEVD